MDFGARRGTVYASNPHGLPCLRPSWRQIRHRLCRRLYSARHGRSASIFRVPIRDRRTARQHRRIYRRIFLAPHFLYWLITHFWPENLCNLDCHGSRHAALLYNRNGVVYGCLLRLCRACFVFTVLSWCVFPFIVPDALESRLYF